MQNTTPLVSVLICTYNRSALLHRSIASVLKQSMQDLELIIIDDCSTDNTPNIIESFADHRIRYVRNQINVGSHKGDRAHVRRFVYELMKGQYFVYLCDDDYWLSDTLLERQIKAFEQYTNVSMVVGGQLSYFIPEGCDFCMLSVEETKRLVFNLNGCFSWFENSLSYIAPNGNATQSIPSNSATLQTMIDEKLTNKKYIIENDAVKFHLSNDEIKQIIDSTQSTDYLSIHSKLPNIADIPHISYNDLHKVPLPRTMFLKELYSKKYMTSQEFLTAFATDPATRNIIAGATLYSRECFIASGAMSNEQGSKWQAGYEFSMSPACCGAVVYLDKPEIVVEVRPSNASFRGTQLDHYSDCIVSINTAFKTPLEIYPDKKKMLLSAKHAVIRNITRSFLSNAVWIKLNNSLTACSAENIHDSVQAKHAISNYRSNGILPKATDLKYFVKLQLPSFALRIVINPKLFLMTMYKKTKKRLFA